MSSRLACLLAALVSWYSPTVAGAPWPAAPVHFPDVHGERVVFTHAGDVWLAPLAGGVARRLTTHPGQELMPRFSPDGRRVAFTGEYDGAWHVFVMDVDGGQPRQLTWAADIGAVPLRMGPNDLVVDWTPDGAGVLFLSRQAAFTPWFGHLYVVPADGGLPVRFPLPKGGLLAWSPDGRQVLYNRIFRNFRTWKRYEGGMAQDLWLYDLDGRRSERWTSWVGTDTSPMWTADGVYFLSDRDARRRLNLWRLDPVTKEAVALTAFEDFDVLWPATDGRTIVFTVGGVLHALALPAAAAVASATGAGAARPVPLQLPGDRPEALPRVVTAKDAQDVALAPGGRRAAFAARGEVFTVPVEHGETRDLTRSPAANDREVAWSPDGRWIAFVSDASGEEELWVVPAVPPASPPSDPAAAVPRQVTRDGTVGRLHPEWSPDSQRVLLGDLAGRLDLVDVASGAVTRVDEAELGEIRHYSWSPDGRYVAYARATLPERTWDVIVYDREDGERHVVTERWTDDVAPIFDRSGRYLFFVSTRRLNPVLSQFDFSFAYTRAHGIFALTLRKDLPDPFRSPPDEAKVARGRGRGGDDGKRDDDGGEGAKKPAPVRIDWDGIAGRVSDLPVAGMNLAYVEVIPKGVLYLRLPTRGLAGTLDAEAPSLHLYDLEKREDVTLLTGVDEVATAPDGGHVLVKQGGAWKVAPLGADPIGDKALETLDLRGLKARGDPPAEWRSMFWHAWRLWRDRFYRGSMHGLDWKALGERYAALLPGIGTRFDLTLLLSELAGELGNSHAYVNQGGEPELPDPRVGMLGVDLALDESSGRYRLARILPGENWRDDRTSPLTVPGVVANEGDYLLAIEGQELRAPTNPHALLVGRAGVETTLALGPRPDGRDARLVRVTPIAHEQGLRYLDWVRTNRERVDRLSGGTVGYVYIPDMGGAGLDAFVEQWFPQAKGKQGMILDVRYNGGGFVDQLLFERLRRVVRLMSDSRHSQPEPFVDGAFHGHLACVTNAYAASDGDLFTWFFREYELGPVVGTRTWGGVRGIRGNLPLLDGGSVTVPESTVYGMGSQWVMENWGVEPTVEVDDLPEEVLAGRDPQLERAVELVLAAIRQQPRPLPPPPPDLPAYPVEGR